MTLTFLTPEQASEKLNGLLSPRTIRQWCRDRKLEHLRGPNNRILFTEDQIQKIPDQMTVAAKTPVKLPQKKTRSPKPKPSPSPQDRDPFGGTALSMKHAQRDPFDEEARRA